jgi:hypothetical protein
MSAIETASVRTSWSATETQPWISEDWLSVVIGLVIFVLALAVLANVDLIGWVVTTSVWSNLGQALGTASKTYAGLGGVGALLATYAALLAVLSAAAVALNADVKKFGLAFTAVFWIAYASWVVGSYANFAAVTPAELQKFGIGWSLRLTNEGGFIFALIAGLIIANVFPRFAETIKDAVRPELYIKIAIVILGGFFAVTAAGKLNLATSCCCCAAPPRSSRLISSTGRWSISSPASGLASIANGRRHWRRASRSAAFRRRSPPAARSVRGRSYRCWSPRWSSSSRWSRY